MRGMIDIGKELQHLMTGAPTPVNKHKTAQQVTPKHAMRILTLIRDAGDAGITVANLISASGELKNTLSDLTNALVRDKYVSYTTGATPTESFYNITPAGTTALTSYEATQQQRQQREQQQQQEHIPANAAAAEEVIFKIIGDSGRLGIDGTWLITYVQQRIPDGTTLRDNTTVSEYSVPFGSAEWVAAVLRKLLASNRIVAAGDSISPDYYTTANAPKRFGDKSKAPVWHSQQPQVDMSVEVNSTDGTIRGVFGTIVGVPFASGQRNAPGDSPIRVRLNSDGVEHTFTRDELRPVITGHPTTKKKLQEDADAQKDLPPALPPLPHGMDKVYPFQVPMGDMRKLHVAPLEEQNRIAGVLRGVVQELEASYLMKYEVDNDKSLVSNVWDAMKSTVKRPFTRLKSQFSSGWSTVDIMLPGGQTTTWRTTGSIEIDGAVQYKTVETSGVDFDKLPARWRPYGSGGGKSEREREVRARMIQGAIIMVDAATAALAALPSEKERFKREALAKIANFSYSALNTDFASGLHGIFDLVYNDPVIYTKEHIIDMINNDKVPSFKAYMDLVVNESAATVANQVTPSAVISMMETVIVRGTSAWRRATDKQTAIAEMQQNIIGALNTAQNIDTETYTRFIEPVVTDANFMRAYIQARLRQSDIGVPNNTASNINELRQAMSAYMQASQREFFSGSQARELIIQLITAGTDVDVIIQRLAAEGIGGTPDANTNMEDALQAMHEGYILGRDDYVSVLRTYLQSNTSATWNKIATDLSESARIMRENPDNWINLLHHGTDNRPQLARAISNLMGFEIFAGVRLNYRAMIPDPTVRHNATDLSRFEVQFASVSGTRGVVFTWRCRPPLDSKFDSAAIQKMLQSTGEWFHADAAGERPIAPGGTVRARGDAFRRILGIERARGGGGGAAAPTRPVTAQQRAMSPEQFISKVTATPTGEAIVKKVMSSISSDEDRFSQALSTELGLVADFNDRAIQKTIIQKAIVKCDIENRTRKADDLAESILNEMNNVVNQAINNLMQQPAPVRNSKSELCNKARMLTQRALRPGTYSGTWADSTNGMSDPRGNFSVTDGPGQNLGLGNAKSQMSYASMRQADAAAGPHTDSSMGMVVPTQLNRSIPGSAPKTPPVVNRPGTAGIPNSSKKIREKAKEQVEEADKKVDTWRVDPNVVDKMREKVQRGLNKPKVEKTPSRVEPSKTTDYARQLLKRVSSTPKRQGKRDRSTINKLEPMSGVPTGYESGIRNNTDKQMGRWQDSGGGVRGLGWDVTGPSVAGTDGKFGP